MDDSQFIIDDETNYSKSIPDGVERYAEITKIGGMTYRDEATGTLKNAAVTKVDSVLGNNLLRYPYRGGEEKIDKGVTFKVNKDGSIRVTGTCTNWVDFSIATYPVKSGETYTISSSAGTVGYGNNCQMFLTGAGISRYHINSPVTFTVWTDGVLSVSIAAYIGNVCNYTFYPILVKGNTAIQYEKYVGDVLEISSEVQALDGYGLGIDSNHNNYIEFTDQDSIYWHKNVDIATKTDATGLSVTSPSGSSNVGFNFALTTYKKENSAFEVSPPFSFTWKAADVKDGKLNGYYASGNSSPNYGHIIYISIPVVELGLTTSATADELKSAFDTWLKNRTANGNPLTFVYQLKEPTIENITNLFTNDNLIEVDKNGLIIAENPNKLDVPFTIKYQKE